jgi:hypothetical protein
MRYAMAAVVAAMMVAGCSQQGSQQQGKADGVADQGLPGGVPTPGQPTTPAIPNTPAASLQNVATDPAAAVSGCLSSEDQARSPDQFSPEERAQKIGCINAAVAAQINRQLPTKVDPLTTLTHIDSAGTQLTYNYTVDIDGARLPPNAIDAVKSSARSTACANPQIRQTLSYGGVYAYRWSDKNGRVLGDLRIDAC